MTLLLTAFCCTVLADVVVSSLCTNTPWIGRSSEIIATNFDTVTCGDPLDSCDCPRYIKATSHNANGYSQVRLAGNYSLLGSVSCNPISGNNNCSLITTGDVIVGCCGSYIASESFVGGDGSTLTIGSNSSVYLAKLHLDKSTSFTVGDNTIISDTLTTSIVIRDRSQLTLISPSDFLFSKSVIDIGGFCDFQFDSKATSTLTESTWISQSGSIELSRTIFFFYQVAISSISTQVTMEDMQFDGAYVNFNLDHSNIHWVNDSRVSLNSGNFTMLGGSSWINVNSTVNVVHVSVSFGNHSTLYLSNCDLSGRFVIDYMISIGPKSSLVLRGNATQRLSCTLTDQLIVPPNVHYTQADLVDSLVCEIEPAIEATDKNVRRSRPSVSSRYEINELSNVQTGDKRMGPKSVMHYESCPIGGTTTATTPQSSTVAPSSKTATSAGPPSSSTIITKYLLLSIAVLIVPTH